MKLFNLQELKQEGFEGFRTIENLINNKSVIPSEKGVYIILAQDNLVPKFLKVGNGGFFKGKNPNVDINILESNWVDSCNTIYIGKATSLRKRLSQYFSFGQGKAIGHYGGRYIWQLENSQDLVVCWKITEKEPREVEKELLQIFISNYGLRPFANLVG